MEPYLKGKSQASFALFAINPHKPLLNFRSGLEKFGSLPQRPLDRPKTLGTFTLRSKRPKIRKRFLSF